MRPSAWMSARLSSLLAILLANGCLLTTSLAGLSGDVNVGSASDARADTNPNQDDGASPEPSAACPAGMFCEDFESGIDPAKWQTLVVGQGTLVADGSRAHRGLRALHMHQPPVAVAGDQLISLSQLPRTRLAGMNEIWSRVYINLAAPVQASFLHLFEISQSSGALDTLEVSVNNQGRLALGPFRGTTVDTTTRLRLDAWVCVEWHIVVASAGLGSLAVDGVDVAETLTSGTAGPPGPGFFDFRFGRYGSGAVDAVARDVWYDDLIVGPTRVGCAR